VAEWHITSRSRATVTGASAPRFRLSPAEIVADYRLAFRSRVASVSGRREVLTGKAPFGIFGDGKEIAQLALAKVFRPGDWRTGYYRDQTFMFATGMSDLPRFFAQLYTNTDVEAEPSSAGRQMVSHFATRIVGPDGRWTRQAESMQSAADLSPVAAHMPRALGLAYASALYRLDPALRDAAPGFSATGEEVTFATIGNAGTSEGLFWETVNAAGVLQVPLLVSVWDDGYGISVPNELQTVKSSISAALAGFQRAAGGNGFVTEPTPAAVGRALERLACDRAFAERLGAAGNERAGQVSWRRTVRALLRDARPRRRSISPRGKPKIVVAATFLAEPALHGGQIRLLHLCKALTASYDVEIVSLVEADRSRKRTILRDGLAQSAIPKTPAHAHADAEASRSVGGLHVTDILASETVSLTPSYVEALGSAAAGAAGIVLSHPYLVTAVEAIDAAVPLVYEAQDVESDLKRALLPTSEVGDRLYALVEAVEEKAVGISVLTTTCSQEDADALVERFGAASSSLVVIPNGVELEAIAYVSTEPRRRSAERWLRSYAASGPSAAGEFRELCVFFGSAHPPNVDAAEQILRFAARRPTTLFAIVGSLCGELNGRTRPENVLLAGVVSPVVKHGLLASAHVGLNPVRIGSGTNLKLVEYLAAGLPVVTTRFGARGLPGDGDGIAAVADVEDFPRAIEQVLVNRATTRERVRRGRALVESGFDWELLGRRFTTAVETALASEA